ncbi:MAG: hypothetical protein GQ580_06375 [Candidatus Thorarchaeota archaeon]|nr:hypothetical protein [Candidatus Thorarchaeota archaeon]
MTVIKVVKENPLERLLKASRKRVAETEERDKLDEIANTIGDRRERDLLDLLASIEAKDGWGTAIQFLIKSAKSTYSAPIGAGSGQRRIEPLKYREVIFAIFSSAGLEPVNCDTVALLDELRDEESMVTATRAFAAKVQDLAIEQFQSGDAFFFDLTSMSSSLPTDLIKMAEAIHKKRMHELVIPVSRKQAHLEKLWHSEYGRIALAEQGVKGNRLPLSDLDSVLSVIQLRTGYRPMTKDDDDSLEVPEVSPSNVEYGNLLAMMTNQDIDGLGLLGSKYSLSLLSTVLESAIAAYQQDKSTNMFRRFISCMSSHVQVRSLNSLATFERVMQLDNSRLVTPVTVALGNFYHESAGSVLIELACRTRSKEVEAASITSITNIHRKCPEVEVVLDKALASECRNRGRLRRFQKRILKTSRTKYYK